MEYTKAPGTRALIFDLDGTLADTMPLHLKAWQLACREYGMDMDSAFLKSRMGRPAWEIGRDIILEYNMEDSVEHESLFKLKIELFKTLRHGLKPIKPVEQIVKKFYGKLPICVGTGAIREAAHRTIKDIGMDSYFDIVVTANDVSNHKPDPETFLKCTELMKIEPSACDVFEDGDLGLEAARRAGMTPVDIRPWIEAW